MTEMSIRAAAGIWTVRAGGAVLVESRNALVLSEAGHTDVIYFPREDIAMAFLDRTDHATSCPKKGEANYFSIVTKSQTLQNAAWSYEAPLPGAEPIAGHIAFYATDFVTIEQI
ncbi:Nucleotidyltransferase [Pseudooceanicola antarcticus]|uniref:Nucleotidyltransferase n=1 Tax=Pseudooceanicola antarcticus TaxID=1247613 RepID=A0A285J6C0_9RHOB|nr:DUF427 domain-containing protein [Pseudooceanicola antarcticus]PJE29729.1 nucleotidyltransferase domain-containing protein [Pseudooceanicola antarcticus]SNY54651.1 Nucleotidyltransferase [Pseudooceanicola antarcticus]